MAAFGQFNLQDQGTSTPRIVNLQQYYNEPGLKQISHLKSIKIMYDTTK